jgi:hypothetical protein
MFGLMSTAEREELAADYDQRARDYAREVRELRAEIKQIRTDHRRCGNPDPEGVRFVTAHLEGNAWVLEANARDCRQSAAQLRKKWWQ